MMDIRLPLVLLSAALLSAPRTQRSPTACQDPTTPRARCGSSATPRRARARKRPTAQVQSFKVGADAALDLSNISGDVQVTGDGGNEIRIEATKRVRHRDANEARRLLQQLRVEMVQVGGRIEVRTLYPRRNEQQRRAQHLGARGLRRHRPAGGGRGREDDFRQRRRHEGERRGTGRDRERRRHRHRHAERRAGADGVGRRRWRGTSAAPPILSLSTVSGSVTASGLKARSLECGVGERQHRAVGRAGGTPAGKVGVGRHPVRRGAGEGRPLRIRSAFRQYPRRFWARTTGFELDASTFSGSVRSDFPVTLRSQTGSSRDRRDANRTIRGAYGDAGAILSIKTFSGTVVISRK